MKSIKIIGALAVLAATVATPALATSKNVKFNGTVGAVCILKVDSGGQLGVKTNYQELNSSKFGGSPGQVTAETSGTDFNISVKAPTAWDVKPATYTDTTTFAAQTTISGVTSGAKKKLPSGTTAIPVNMAAKPATAGTLFTYGDYEATVVVTCEK